MIGKTEQRKLKRVLKNSFIADVQKVLKEENILNQKGEPYGKGYISHVFKGRNSNEAIEKAIYKVYEDRKREQAKMRVFKQNILENKNPEVEASGLND